MAKKARPRTQRREAERDVVRLNHKLDRLEVDLPGGSAARAIAVTTVSVIEVRARAEHCLACEGELTIRAHEAEGSAARPLRRIELGCVACRRPRTLWFSLAPAGPN